MQQTCGARGAKIRTSRADVIAILETEVTFLHEINALGQGAEGVLPIAPCLCRRARLHHSATALPTSELATTRTKALR